MAYEIFDDIAFYYMLTTIISLFLFPLLAYKLYQLVTYLRAQSNKQPAPLPTQRKLVKDVQTEQVTLGSFLTFSNLSLVLLILVFVALLTQLSSYNASPLASYDPYAILGVTSAASDAELKRAYRALSLKWHPDKNVDNAEEANRQFIAITKAYEALTSPEAKDNIAQYGNPEGYKGMSVTIGLPSFLTKKENEMRVLLIYFLIFMVLPPVGVYVWWTKARDYSDSGVMVETMKYYRAFTLDNYGPKFLIETLALSQENELALQPPLASHPQFAADYQRLFATVKDSMVKQKFFDTAAAKDPSKRKINPRYQYVHACSVVWHAYLQRVAVPASLQPLLRHMLKRAHPLLQCMLDVCVMPQPVMGPDGIPRQSPSTKIVPALGVVDLMQMVTQSLWVHENPLKQLPHIGEDEVRALMKKNVRSIVAVTKMDDEKRQKVLPELTAEQWKEIDAVCACMPDVRVDVTAGVEDEEDVYEGDIVRVHVQLTRESLAGQVEEVASREQMDGQEEEEKAADTKKPASATAKKEPALPSSKAEEKEDGSSVPSQSTKVIDDTNLTEDQLADLVPMPVVKKADDATGVSPAVHAPYFPFEKREKWMLLLVSMDAVDRTKPRHIVSFTRAPPLSQQQTVDLRFQAPPVEGGGAKGWQEHVYKLYVLCDSYVGMDRQQTIVVKVKKVRKPQAGTAADELKEEADEPKDDKSFLERMLNPDEEYESKWYLLGCASVWELLLNVVVLSLLAVFLFNFLHSRGYWQVYVSPVLDVVARVMRPVTDRVEPFVTPITQPVVGVVSAVYAWLHARLHVEPLPPMRRKKGAKGGRMDRIPVEDDVDDEEVQARKREKEERLKGEEVPGMGEDEEEEVVA